MLSFLALLFGCSNEPRFVRDEGGWRYEGLRLDVDAASFEPLGKHYGVDREKAVYVDTYRDSVDYFTTKRLRMTVVRQAELASFRVLDDDHARDRSHVYYEGRPFEVKDVASFQLLEYGFARDNAVGYYHQTMVAGSEGASFQGVDHHFAQDSRRVWWCDIGIDTTGTTGTTVANGAQPSQRCTVLPGAVPAGFEALERRYSRSGSRVYHEGRIVAGADAASFVAGHGFEGQIDAHDASSSYIDGRRVGPASAALAASSPTPEAASAATLAVSR